MDLADYFIVILLIVGINLIVLGILLDTNTISSPSPQSKLQSKRQSINMLDLQFSKDNWPSVIYGPLFTEANPFMGGYKLASKVTAVEERSSTLQPLQPTSTTGMLRVG
jgi:hypothetical protein